MGCLRPGAPRTRALSPLRSLIDFLWPCSPRRTGDAKVSGWSDLPPNLCAPAIARRSAPGVARRLLPGVSGGTRRVPPERPISRVLCRRRVAPTKVKVIPLGRPLLGGSSTLTRTSRLDLRLDDRADRSRRCPYSSLLREGLASPPVTRLSRVGSYPTISPLPVKEPSNRPPTCQRQVEGTRRVPPIGGFFSAALSLGSPRVAVSDLPVLWSPDFPPVNGVHVHRRPSSRLRRARASYRGRAIRQRFANESIAIGTFWL